MNIFEIEEIANVISEGSRRKKKLFRTRIMRSGFLNKNGRIYPEAVVKQMVTKAKEQIEGNKLYGSSFHPKDGVGAAHDAAWI